LHAWKETMVMWMYCLSNSHAMLRDTNETHAQVHKSDDHKRSAPLQCC
jgi:hypothetical protein